MHYHSSSALVASRTCPLSLSISNLLVDAGMFSHEKVRESKEGRKAREKRDHFRGLYITLVTTCRLFGGAFLGKVLSLPRGRPNPRIGLPGTRARP